MHRSHRFLRLITILLLGGFSLGVCFVALAPGIETVAAGAQYSGKVAPRLRALEGPTVLYDANGDVLDRLGYLDRTPVALNTVPKFVKDAVISTEDRTFYSNRGVDFRSTVRALISNVDSGGIDQGGSTITQQLIKNRFFTNPKRDLDRKVREAVLAARLTGEWSKARIFEEYLNTVYFGENAYGINAAAQRIIGKPLAELSLAEAALLAGVIKSPSDFDPFTQPEAALARRAHVLREMRKQKVITAAEFTLAEATPLPLSPNCDLPNSHPKCTALQAHSIYATEVKNRLLELEVLGADEQIAAQRVFRGGLRVYTAYRPDLAWMAQNAVDSTVGQYKPFTAAMAVMEPKTGEVYAVVGGDNPQGFNLATMGPANAGGRGVGSTFKPITLATAIENKYSPKDSVSGSAPCFATYEPWHGLEKKKFVNAGDGDGGTDSLFNQTKNSVNCAYVNLFTSVGPPKVVEMAKRLGMIRPVNPYLASAIGDTEHSPLEMATVYSTFASEGVRHDPVFIKRVEDEHGRVLYRAPGGKRVLSPEVARTVTDVLSHVTEGTAARAKLGNRPLAGKTGTRDSSVDAWFAGYTPQLTAVVWMGDPALETPMKNVGQFRAVYGGTYPAIIWQKFMSEALKGKPFLAFVKPDETLWPTPARVNPEGGRGAELFDFSGLLTTTSTTTPTQSTTTSSTSSSTTTTTTTTTIPPGP